MYITRVRFRMKSFFSLKSSIQLKNGSLFKLQFTARFKRVCPTSGFENKKKKTKKEKVGQMVIRVLQFSMYAYLSRVNFVLVTQLTCKRSVMLSLGGHCQLLYRERLERILPKPEKFFQSGRHWRIICNSI